MKARVHLCTAMKISIPPRLRLSTRPSPSNSDSGVPPKKALSITQRIINIYFMFNS